MDLIEIGTALKEKRGTKTKAQVAKDTGLHKDEILKIERGLNVGTLKLEKYAKYLKVKTMMLK